MNSVKCPSCGAQIALPPQIQKTGLPWWAGCLIAAAVVPIAVAVLGILAAHTHITPWKINRSVQSMEACRTQ